MARLMMAAGTALILLASSVPGFAQATRTWVSGVGDDVNPCSRTAPCKTLAGAISKTAVAGEISILDPGGFGAVTITKSISIVAEGGEGGVLACLTNAIVINSSTANVNLRGLIIEGCGNGLSGIRVIAANSVHVEKCLINGFRGNTATNAGIEIVNTAGAPKIVVTDTSVINNNRGILAQPTAPGTATVTLNRVVASANLGPTIRAITGSTFWMNQSVVTGNATGLSISGGTIHSFGNNVVENNTSNGTPTDVIPLK